MKKISNPAAYYTRLQQLAEVNKSGVKESKNRGIGTLIDYKKSTDGTSYGIIKENHHYYIKKAGLKENPDSSDFTYIGGMENITEYQYKSLAEADKKRNMMLHVLNESATIITNKSKTKIVKEDVVDDKIKSMEHTTSKLDGATAVEKQAKVPNPEIPDLTDDQPIPDGEPTEELPAGEEAPVDTEEPVEGEDKEFEEIQSDLGKAVEKIQSKELSKAQVKTVLNSIISAVKPGLAQFEVEEREDLAEPIIKAEDVDGAADLETNMPDDELELAEEDSSDLTFVRDGLAKINAKKEAKGEEPIDIEEFITKYIKENVGEMKCDECGTFGQYAESRGYSKKALVEADNDEKSSIISGYINAFNEGKNHGDAKVISILAKKAIVESLINEYGHGDYVEKQLKPQLKTLNEATYKTRVKLLNEEFKIGTTGTEGGDTTNTAGIDNETKDLLKKLATKISDPEKVKEMAAELLGNSVNETEIDEIFGGLGDKFAAVGDTVKGGINTIKDKYNQNLQTRQDATTAKKAEEDRIAQEKADALKKSELSGSRMVSVDVIKQHGRSLVAEIIKLNATRVESGLEPLPVDSFFRSMANQVGKAGSGEIDLSKGSKGYTTEGKGLPTGTVEVQPNMLQEVDDDDLEDKLLDDIELDDNAVETPEEDNLDLDLGMEAPATDMGTPEMGFAPDSANMGFEAPDHSGVSIVDVNVDGNNKTVNIKLNEALKALKVAGNALANKKGKVKVVNEVELANAKGGTAKPAAVTATNIKGTKQDKTGGTALVNAKGGTAKPAAVTTTNTKGTKQEKTIGTALAGAKGQANKKSVNEISMGLANKASDAAYEKRDDTEENNPLDALKATDQARKFKTYLNPQLSNELNSIGVKFTKEYGGITLYIPTTNSENAFQLYVYPNTYKIVNGNSQDVDPSLLRKVSVIIKKLQADMKTQDVKPDNQLEESENKTKKYIRAKLEELAGFRKPMLNESTKSPALKKLDEMIEIEYTKSK